MPRRERLPDTRKSLTHKFNVAGHEGYITVGLYDDGRPGELFITMAKEGSTIGGLMDCFGTAVSMSLQYGVPLEVYVSKFSHTRFEPMGHTKNPDIRIAKSIVDYIFRWLGVEFLPGYREAMLGHPATDEVADRHGRRGNRDSARRHEGWRAEKRARTGRQQTADRNQFAHRGQAALRQERHRCQGGRQQRQAARAGRRDESRSQRRGEPLARAESSPASRPMPPVATTAARSPFAMAIATCAITAATVWVARKGLSGRRPASSPPIATTGAATDSPGAAPVFCYAAATMILNSVPR